MTVLAKDRQVYRKDGVLQQYGTIANDVIYQGSLVSTMFGHATEAGYIQPATNEWLNVFVGVTKERGVTNSTAGEVKVDVYKNGTYRFEYDGTPTQAMVGEVAFVVDDQTVGLGGSANTSYMNPCGVIVGLANETITSGTDVWVRIDGYTDLFPATESYVLLNSQSITRGGIISEDTAGEARAGADTTNYIALGIAVETVDNSGDGLSIRVISFDPWARPVMLDGTQTTGNYTIGDPMYMDGARAVDDAGNTANVDAFLGKVVRLIANNNVYININTRGEAAAG